jgi:predicted membrane channel-forming protein YqfA (hemolysin III family)
MLMHMRRRREPLSRGVLYLGFGILLLWLVWAALYEATGLPGIDYLSFGLVSVPVGAVFFSVSLVGYARAVAGDYVRRDALQAMLVSAAVAAVPFIALLELAEDYS